MDGTVVKTSRYTSRKSWVGHTEQAKLHVERKKLKYYIDMWPYICVRCVWNIYMGDIQVVNAESLLVLRRRVSAKRRTIVFSTVRPSLQQIIELSRKNVFQVFYTFNGIIKLMNHVRLYVCPWILFSFDTWNEHILELCLGVLFLKNLKNWNFDDILKMVIFGDFAH